MQCNYCKKTCIKKGKAKHVQRYQCSHCKRYQQKEYTKQRISKHIYNVIESLTCENVGTCGLSRFLGIAKSSVQRIIQRIASLYQMEIEENKATYEIDELCTYMKNKKNRIWVMYAYNPKTQKIAAMEVGRRTKENIKKILKEVHKLKPKKIFTDKLNIYRALIPNQIHQIYIRCINHIERFNLNLRTWLKCLNRHTLSYPKSEEMLYCRMLLIISRQNG